MRISFDSNVWERLFALSSLPVAQDRPLGAIRQALSENQIKGFICDAALRIEAIAKTFRAPYLATVAPRMTSVGTEERNGKRYLRLSIAPDDAKHPGLPDIQTEKLKVAQEFGIKLMRGLNWMSLPRPLSTIEYVTESLDERGHREQRQNQIFFELVGRGVGKAPFDKIIAEIDSCAGQTYPGWSGLYTLSGDKERKRVARACAEWADAELVAAHAGYRNNLLCTEDHARSARNSTFDSTQRRWLSNRYGIRFVTIAGLYEALK